LIEPILPIKFESHFIRKFVNLQTLGVGYSRNPHNGLVGRPDTESLIPILSAVHGKQLETIILVVYLHSVPKRELHLIFKDSRWKVLDALLCDVERFRVLGKVMLVAEYFDIDFLLKMFNCGSDCGLLDKVKMAFKGLISTRRLQLVLRCVTIFIFSFDTST
jgi:hypothetical protein